MQYSQTLEGCQPKAGEKVDRWFQQLGAVLWPASCVLCLAPTRRARDLCETCERDFSSNSVRCRMCSQPLHRACNSDAVCGSCLRSRSLIDASFVPFRYEYPLDRLVQRLKYGKDLSIARVLGEVFAERHRATPHLLIPEAIVPVPLGRRRYIARGFNQAHELARCIASARGVAIRSDLVERVRETQEQAGLPRRQRKRNVRGAFRATRALPASHVAIFDDVVTTGSTVNELARVLRRAGAKKIEVWAIARAGR